MVSFVLLNMNSSQSGNTINREGELTKGQQYIAAADKTAGLLEAAANQENEEVIIAAAATGTGEEEPVEPAKKKGFWQKLFGRE